MADAPDQRWAVKPGERSEPRVERDGTVWRIRSLAVARQVLRARDRTTQAGFTSEKIPKGNVKHPPILPSAVGRFDGCPEGREAQMAFRSAARRCDPRSPAPATKRPRR